MNNASSSSLYSYNERNNGNNNSSSNKSNMGPICETDFESRLFFNSRTLPKQKSCGDRPNDFVVDYQKYKSLKRMGKLKEAKSLKNCYQTDNSDVFEKTSLRSTYGSNLIPSDVSTSNIYINESQKNNQSYQSRASLNPSFISNTRLNVNYNRHNSNNLTENNQSPNDVNDKNTTTGFHSNYSLVSSNNNAKLCNLTADYKINYNYINPPTEHNMNIKQSLTSTSLLNKTKSNTTNQDGIDYLRKDSDSNRFSSTTFMKPSRSFIHKDVNDLIGKPTHYVTTTPRQQPATAVNKPRNKRAFKYRVWQCRIYNYLERPKGWKSILYHMLVSKRMSLIQGKQLYYTPITKHSMRYRAIQLSLYNFLERPVGFKAALYQLTIFSTVFVCLVLSVLATIPQYEVQAGYILMNTEIVIVFWLSIELTLRVWSSGCRSRYQTWKGRLRFMRNVFCILDLTVIVASIVLTIIATSQNRHKNFAAAAFRGLRFFQILRMLRVDRRAGTWRLLGTVVWAHRQELITTFYIGFLSLIISSFIMYLLEKDHPDTLMSTYADSLWWGVITLCTIGYGDVYPKTPSGKLLASGCALVGISFFALPAGILGSGFALKVQAMQRQKHLNRRRAPAAALIQCVWRCYASDPTSLSEATWKPSVRALQKEQRIAQESLIRRRNSQTTVANSPAPPPMGDYSIANLVRPIRNSSNSFINRISSIKKSSERSPTESNTKNSGDIEGKKKSYLKMNSLNLEGLHGTPPSPNINPNVFNGRASLCSFDGGLSSPETTCGMHEGESLFALNNSNTNTITNCEPSAFAIERETSTSNIRSPKHIPLSEQKKTTLITPIKSSFAHRTLNFFSDFNSQPLGVLEKRLDDTEQEQWAAEILTMQHKHAIRAMRKIRYFVARRKFREALRPYDVTDVIEQYSAGNLDMLARIKTLQFRLDKILGSSKSKDCYDSHSISLATRIVKVERQMDNISIKFDRFFTGYSSDMKILMDTFKEKNNSTHIDSVSNQELKSIKSTTSSLRFKLDYEPNNSIKSPNYNTEQNNKKLLKKLKLRGLPIRHNTAETYSLGCSISDFDTESDVEQPHHFTRHESLHNKKIRRSTKKSYQVNMQKYCLNQMNLQVKRDPNNKVISNMRSRSDSMLSLKSDISLNPFHNKTKNRHHITVDNDSSSYHNDMNMRSNLLETYSKSDIICVSMKSQYQLDDSFTKLLQRKQSEKQKSKYPKIFISKPDDIYDIKTNFEFPHTNNYSTTAHDRTKQQAATGSILICVDEPESDCERKTKAPLVKSESDGSKKCITPEITSSISDNVISKAETF